MKMLVILILAVLCAGEIRADYLADYATAMGLVTNGQYAAGQAALEKILVDYPSLGVDRLLVVNYRIGCALGLQQKYVEAIAKYGEMLQDTKMSVRWQARIQYDYANMLMGLGRKQEAQEKYVSAATTCFVSLPWMKRVVRCVDPAMMSKEQYLEFLQRVVILVPAVPANADFLGYLKSEMGKLQ